MRLTVLAIFTIALLSGNAQADQPTVLVTDGKLTPQEKSAILKQKNILDEIMNLYAEKSLDRPADFTACIREMFAMSRSKKCRDKFTHYETPEAAKQEQENFTGQFGGIGLELTDDDGAVVVNTPIAGTPSERAGIKAKDIILKVDDQEPEDTKEAVSLIRGKPGTKVVLTIFRPETKQEMKFTLTREIIELKTVKWRISKTNPKVGIIEIRMFDETVPVEFAKAVVELQKKHAPNIIIDVRNDPGGLVNSVLALLGLFAQSTDTLLTEHTRDEQTVTTLHNLSPIAKMSYVKAVIIMLKAMDMDSFRKINAVVLINNGSASASEIFAGTMKDWGYPIVGEKSFGKGVGQNMFNLSDGSVFSLTTFEFLVGNHKIAIRDQGVTPTVEVKMPETPIEKDKKELSDKEKEQADPQLLRAIELLEACRQNGTAPIQCHRN